MVRNGAGGKCIVDADGGESLSAARGRRSADRITVVALGAGRTEPQPRDGPLVVAAPATDASLMRELAARSPRVRTPVLPPGVPSDLRAVDIVAASQGGDRWGMLVPAALAHSCHAVILPPLDAAVVGTAGVRLAGDAKLVSVLLDLCADADVVRRRATAIRLAATHRLDAALGAQGAAETARALVHGTPATDLIEVGAALAAHLRTAPAMGAA